jgi:probable lipoprotein NlpC
MPKLRFATLLLALFGLMLVVDGCRSRRKNKKKHKTTLRQRIDKAGRVLEIPQQPSAPLTDKDLATVIRTARSFTGTPYLAGGTTRTGMDCSGLVTTSFQAVQKTLPRISYQQAEAGSAISESELAPGDLVFFTDRKGNTRISHVGIITELKSKETVKFIHASNSLGVVENNLKQPYWHNLFLKGVRIR